MQTGSALARLPRHFADSPEGRTLLEQVRAAILGGQYLRSAAAVVADRLGVKPPAIERVYRFTYGRTITRRTKVDLALNGDSPAGEEEVRTVLVTTSRTARPPADLSQLPSVVADWLTGYYVRGKSGATVLSYRDDVRLFLRFLEARGLDLFSVTPDVVGNYHRTLWRSRLKASTRSRYLVSLRQLFAHLVKAGYMTANPAALVDLPRIHKRPPQFFTDQEVQQLRRATPDTRAGRRDRAILELALSSLRQREILGLDLDDLMLDRQQVKLAGKGGDTVLQVVTEAAVRALRAWLDVRGSVNSPAVFVALPDAGGRRRPDGRMDVSTAFKMFKRYCHLAGVRPLRFHDLRHTAGTKLGDADVPLAVIQQVLRHTNPATSNIYVHIAGSKLREAMEKLAFPE